MFYKNNIKVCLTVKSEDVECQQLLCAIRKTAVSPFPQVLPSPSIWLNVCLCVYV